MGTFSTDVDGANDVPSQVSIKHRSERKCQGAMSQQGLGAHGNECYPQKLVRLVGHRDPSARMESWDRLRVKVAVRDVVK